MATKKIVKKTVTTIEVTQGKPPDHKVKVPIIRRIKAKVV